MGGYNSGRRGGFGTTDGTLTLDMRDCMRLRRFVPGFAMVGSLAWTNKSTGTVVGRVSYSADLRDPENALVTVAYTATVRGVAVAERYNVALTTTRPYFGGVRWWFICPLSGRRVRCLHLAGHCPKFASRTYLGIGYRVQRENWSHQRIRAARAADTKLGGDGCIMGDPPAKPKRMHWSTYYRLCEGREREAFRSFQRDPLFAGSDWVAAEIAADPSLVAGRR